MMRDTATSSRYWKGSLAFVSREPVEFDILRRFLGFFDRADLMLFELAGIASTVELLTVDAGIDCSVDPWIDPLGRDT